MDSRSAVGKHVTHWDAKSSVGSSQAWMSDYFSRSPYAVTGSNLDRISSPYKLKTARRFTEDYLERCRRAITNASLGEANA